MNINSRLTKFTASFQGIIRLDSAFIAMR